MRRDVFVKGRPSQIICTVRKNFVIVTCDGHELIRWQGNPQQLRLGDYWNTPNETALFLGSSAAAIASRASRSRR